MSLLYFDGFESYNAYTDVNKVGWTLNSSYCLQSSVSRTGSQALYFDYSYNGSCYCVADPDDIIFHGFAFRSTQVSAVTLCQIMNGNSYDLTLRLNNGYIEARTGNTSGPVIGTATTGQMQTDTWYYVELKTQISNSTTDTCIFKVDGQTALTLSTGSDTSGSTTNYPSRRIAFPVSVTGGTILYVDDIYICNDSGSVNNTFLGPVRVDTLRPNGNGNSSDWDGSDGNQVDNYQLVDETTIGGSDYIEAQNVNEKDLFTYSDLSFSVSAIHGVKVTSVGKKTTSAIRTEKHVCRRSSTDYDASDTLYLPETTSIRSSIWETDPSTGTAWTSTGVNAAEFGIKVAS